MQVVARERFFQKVPVQVENPGNLLISSAAIFPLVAAPLILLGRFLLPGGADRSLTAFAAGLSLLCLGAGGVGLHQNGIILGPFDSDVLLDPLAIVFPAVMAWSIIGFSAGCYGTSSAQPPLTKSFAALLLLATVQWGSVTANVWEQWGTVSLTGWLLALWRLADGGEQNHISSIGRSLIWWTIADFCWLSGLLILAGVIPSSLLTEIADPHAIDQLSKGDYALASSGATLLLVSIFIRCGLFPFATSSEGFTETPSSTLAFSLFGLGSGLILFLRWRGLWMASQEVSGLILGLGVFSSLLLPLFALAQSSPSRRLALIAAGQTGLVVAGVVATSSENMIPVILSVGLLLLVPTIGMVLFPEPAVGSLSRRKRIFVLLMSAFLLSGLLGQEQIFEAIRTQQIKSAVSPIGLMVIALAGHVLSADSLFRLITSSSNRIVPAIPLTEAIPGHSSLMGRAFAVASFLLAGAIVFASTRLGWLNTVSVPLLSLIALLIGMISSQSLPSPHTEGTNDLVRLVRFEFYIPMMLQAVAATIGFFVKLSAYLVEFVTDRLLVLWPVEAIAAAAEAGTLMDEERTDRWHMIHLLTACGVMLAALAISRW